MPNLPRTEPIRPQHKEMSSFLQFAQKYYSVCQMICFVGIVVCYTVYAHLQEVL